MTEQELEVYLKENFIRMEDYLLKCGKFEIENLGNITINIKHFRDDEVIIYQLLSEIKASYIHRNERSFRHITRSFTEENIETLVDKFDYIINYSSYTH